MITQLLFKAGSTLSFTCMHPFRSGSVCQGSKHFQCPTKEITRPECRIYQKVTIEWRGRENETQEMQQRRVPERVRELKRERGREREKQETEGERERGRECERDAEILLSQICQHLLTYSPEYLSS